MKASDELQQIFQSSDEHITEQQKATVAFDLWGKKNKT